MNSARRKMAAAVLGALGAPLFIASSAAAGGPAPGPPAAPAAADIKLVYDTPRVTMDGDHLIWRWTLTNAGSGAAGGVVLIHRLTPSLKISHLAKECRAMATGVSCSYGTIKAGQHRAGSLEAELSPDLSGTVQINGRVTWQQAAAGPAGSDTEVTPANPTNPAKSATAGTATGAAGAAPSRPTAPAGAQAPAHPAPAPVRPGQAPARPGRAPVYPGQPGQPQEQTGQSGHAAPSAAQPVPARQ